MTFNKNRYNINTLKKERGIPMKRVLNFALPDSYRNERIISVKLDQQSKSAMRLMIESCPLDFKVAARKWLEEHFNLGDWCTTRRRNVTVVKNRIGDIGIAIYHKEESILYDPGLGELLALADSFRVKEEMMKDIGMV